MWFVCTIVLVLAVRLNGQDPPNVTTTTSRSNVGEETTIGSLIEISTTAIIAVDQSDGIDNASTAPETTSFKGLSLDDKSSSTMKSTSAVPENSKNVYRVSNGRSDKQRVSVDDISTTGTPQIVRSFEIYKRLFDQSQWRWNDIAKVTGRQCATDMESYLKGLSNQVHWAMQGNWI